MPPEIDAADRTGEPQLMVKEGGECRFRACMPDSSREHSDLETETPLGFSDRIIVGKLVDQVVEADDTFEDVAAQRDG